MENNIVCKICNREFSSNIGLCNHISGTHKSSIENYYEKYILTEPNGKKCHNPECNNDTKFICFSKGFSKYCSYKCSSNSIETKDKKKKTMINKYGAEYALQVEEIKEKVKQTNLNKYGCESPLQSEEIRKKSKQMCLNRYGAEYALQVEEIKEKSKNTCLQHYGYEHPMKSGEIKNKIKQTMINKYGVEHPLQVEEFKERSKRTCLEKYGVENALQSNDIKNKIKQTNLKKYGCENPFQSEEIKNKIKKINMDKYGVEYPSKLEEFNEKAKQTRLEKYGVEYASQSEEIKEKSKQTCLEKYGYENPMQTEEFKEKFRQTCLKNYGVEYPGQSEEIKEKFKQTCLEKYGVENPFQSNKVKEKSKQTCLDKYGTEYVSQSNEIKEKIKKTTFKKFFDSLFTSDRLEGKVLPNFTLNDYKGIENKYSWICTKCNTTFEDHLRDGRIPRCPTCYPLLSGTSIGEQEIYNFVQQYFSDAESRNRSIISPMELDIYIPSRNFAIEFDGLFWHSEIGGNHDKNYHLNKTNECAKNNIKLIHIFEDEWMNKQEIIKSIILNKLGLTTNRVHARKCIVKKVNNEEAFKFLNNNHLQGSINGNHIGLFYNDELVSILTYGKPRFNRKRYDIEILRFCNKLNTTVIGGLSKLIKNLNTNSIITYVDKRFGNGNAYRQCGFNLIGESKPSYYYTYDYINRTNRIHFQKHKLNNLLKEFDSNLTEWQNMQLSGYDRIWDCGNYIYKL